MKSTLLVAIFLLCFTARAEWNPTTEVKKWGGRDWTLESVPANYKFPIKRGDPQAMEAQLQQVAETVRLSNEKNRAVLEAARTHVQQKTQEAQNEKDEAKTPEQKEKAEKKLEALVADKKDLRNKFKTQKLRESMHDDLIEGGKDHIDAVTKGGPKGRSIEKFDPSSFPRSLTDSKTFEPSAAKDLGSSSGGALFQEKGGTETYRAPTSEKTESQPLEPSAAKTFDPSSFPKQGIVKTEDGGALFQEKGGTEIYRTPDFQKYKEGFNNGTAGSADHMTGLERFNSQTGEWERWNSGGKLKTGGSTHFFEGSNGSTSAWQSTPSSPAGKILSPAETQSYSTGVFDPRFQQIVFRPGGVLGLPPIEQEQKAGPRMETVTVEGKSIDVVY